ncbi:MAG TPA: hypothetical protein PKH65_04390 [Bacteroidia bacterium]|nr:hypothetical protein [Bacteroidia bacterium]HNT79898.1 hypothetical protein [Bacteroidia bacterium]
MSLLNFNIVKSKCRFRLCKYILIFPLFLLSACTNNPFLIDTSNISIPFELHRFDKKLFEKSHYSQEEFVALQSEFGSFLDVYLNNVVRLSDSNDSLTLHSLNAFISDVDIKTITQTTQKEFPTLKGNDEKLHQAFKHYAYYFPESTIPKFITFISAFNYQTIATDSVLGIGLDMYLGSECNFYPSLGIPNFVIRKLSHHYMASDAMRGWLQTEFTEDSLPFQMLPRMIYHGKIQYALRAMFPTEEDTILSGYSKEQLEWCYNNEYNIWTFLVENKWLYNNQPSEYFKFITDAASTNGLPKESPGRIGVFIGEQIVKAYMKKNENITLAQLMVQNDAQKILIDSGYKPKK